MYFGAISTDIKKSSTLWMNYPLWMKNAVKRTNNITEYVFKITEKEGITQKQLPNSPEGDAYTFLYECGNQDKLIEHVKRVGHVLQNVYRVARERNILRLPDEEAIRDNLKEAITNKDETVTFLMSEEFYSAIYVRIGVAFSDIAPIEYAYEVGTNYNNKYIYKSYWESVIAESERAEAHGAPYKDGIGITQENSKVVEEKSTSDNSTFTVSETLNGEAIPFPIESIALTKAVYDRERSDDEKVNGYMFFIHYKLHLTWEDVLKEPHLYQSMLKEFEDVHNDAQDTMKEYFGNIELVKVKRSSDSMFYLPIELKGKKQVSPAPSTVWNKCLLLASHLPCGSSIGICFTAGKSTPTGMLNKVTDKEKFGGYKRTDFFGDCVNLAARMAGTDWSYNTGKFKTQTNDHKSRVAMCNADQTTKGWEMWKVSSPGTKNNFLTPFLLEDIPRKNLNAGSGALRTISAHVYLGDNIQVGDEVTWEEKDERKKGRVTRVDYLTATIELENNDLVRKNITYLEKVQKAPLKKIAPPLPKKKNEVLKGGLAPLKF